MDFVKAAAYPAAYLTAYVALVIRGNLKADETLLVHGSTGGVGMAAVDVGKLIGATVIATSASDEKLKVVKARGADHVINVTRGFREEVKALTDGRGADVIYDPVGGDVFDESVRCIAWNGRLLIIGFTSGRIPSVPVNMPLIKGFSVVGVRAGEYGRRDPEAGRANIAAIDKLAAEGKIDPYVCATFPLERAVEAMGLLQNRQAVGKVVITMN
jgi:NADPH2:quinone reductase